MSYANAWKITETNITTDKLRFKFSSLGGKISEIGIMGALKTDTIAPAAITNLAAVNISEDAVTLAWTATGDDAATGKATAYDLRVSEEPITGDNFSNALKIQERPIHLPVPSLRVPFQVKQHPNTWLRIL